MFQHKLHCSLPQQPGWQTKRSAGQDRSKSTTSQAQSSRSDSPTTSRASDRRSTASQHQQSLRSGRCHGITEQSSTRGARSFVDQMISRRRTARTTCSTTTPTVTLALHSLCTELSPTYHAENETWWCRVYRKTIPKKVWTTSMHSRSCASQLYLSGSTFRKAAVCASANGHSREHLDICWCVSDRKIPPPRCSAQRSYCVSPKTSSWHRNQPAAAKVTHEQRKMRRGACERRCYNRSSVQEE